MVERDRKLRSGSTTMNNKQIKEDYPIGSLVVFRGRSAIIVCDFYGIVVDNRGLGGGIVGPSIKVYDDRGRTNIWFASAWKVIAKA